MLKSLLSAFAIFVLLFATLISPAATYARRCPVAPPSTLLSLYRQSDTIYVARYEKSVEGEVIRQDEDSKTVEMSDHFTITKTLKGDTRKFFVHSYEQYHYLDQQAVIDVEAEDEDWEEGPMPKPGDTVLLFLKRSEDGKSLEPANYRDAVKKLSDKQLPSYEERIKELNSIFSGKKVSDSEIVKWIIRCAEDPATRWEGAFELLQSFEALDWKEERAKRLKEQIANGEASKDDESVAEGEDADTVDTSAYARLLGDDQKQALVNVLLNREPEIDDNGESKTAELAPGDRVLIDLVKRWADSRLAAFMLDQLRNSSDDNYAKVQMMNIVAEVLKDKELSTLAEKFGEIAYEKDDDAVEGNEVNEEAEVPVTDEAEPVVNAESPEAENTGESEIVNADEPEPAKQTYKDLRAELLSKFLDRAQVVLAADEAKKAEK